MRRDLLLRNLRLNSRGGTRFERSARFETYNPVCLLMTLSAGAMVTPYVIQSPLGVGGLSDV
jgi:hypothetical protein